MGKLQGCFISHAVRSILFMVILIMCFARPCSSLHNHGNDTTTRNRVSERLIANRILTPTHIREKSKGSHQHLATNSTQHQQTTTSPKPPFNRSVFSSRIQRPPMLPDDAVSSALPSRRLLSTMQDQIQTDEDLYKFIAIHNDFLILCSHPPPTFSNKFFYSGDLYDPEANCTFDKGIMSSFVSVADFCEYLFIHIYGTTDLFFMRIFSEIPKVLYHNKTFQNLCVPFYEIKYGCKYNELFTACNNDSVIFLDSEVCPQPTVFTDFSYHVANYVLENNFHCLAKICDGTYLTRESEVSGVKFKVSNVFIMYENQPCDVFVFVGTFSNVSVLYTYVNNHWPCCFAMHAVYWAEHPEKHGLNGMWDFLPFSCRVGEVCLIVLVACVATGGVAGNLMVIVVLLRISNRNEESNMLRLSLAVADFLTCAFVVLPSLYEHVKPLLTPREPMIVHQVEDLHDLEIGDTFDSTDVYFPLKFFQGLAFASCSIVSLLTLFLLSAERFVMTGRGLMYKHYITPPRIRQAMVISWVIGWVNSSLMTVFGRSVPTVSWMTFVKIPVGMSYYAHEDLVVYTCYIIQIFLLSISIPATVLLSILSIKNFVQEQNRVRERWHNMQMRVSGPFESENYYIFVTQVLMTVFFLISVIPLSIYFLNFNLLQLEYYSPHSAVIENYLYVYLSWWLFLASTAWNPWIYNMRSQNFRAELWKLKYVCIPLVLREKWRSRHMQENSDALTRRQKLLSQVGIFT